MPGFSVTGNANPEIENPPPDTLPALMVTGDVPDDVKSTVCVDGEFRLTVPKEILVVASVSPGVPLPTLIAKLFVTPPACAVSVAVCELVTVETTAANPALLAPAGTVTELGTTTALLLLPSATVRPPLGAAPV